MSAVYTILYLIVWPFFNLLHPYKTIGRDNIPNGGALICANHSALSDPVYLVYAFQPRNRLRAMAKSELMRTPVLGWLLKSVGMFGVERGKSDIKAIKFALKVLKNGEKLLIFPEGTRSKEGSSGEAKTGAAMLALRSGVPIVPVYIPRNKKWFKRIRIIIGAPYYPTIKGKKATTEDYRAIAEETMNRICALGEQVKA